MEAGVYMIHKPKVMRDKTKYNRKRKPPIEGDEA
jgi:hypothetical protein